MEKAAQVKSLNAYEHLNSSPVIEGGGEKHREFFFSGSRAKISVFLKYPTKEERKGWSLLLPK